MEGSPGGALGPPGVSPGLGERGDQVAPPAGPGRSLGASRGDRQCPRARPGGSAPRSRRGPSAKGHGKRGVATDTHATQTHRTTHDSRLRARGRSRRRPAGPPTASWRATAAPRWPRSWPFGAFRAHVVRVCEPLPQAPHGQGLCHKLFSQNNNARKKNSQNFLFFANILSTGTNHLFAFPHESFQFVFTRINHADLSLIIV